RWGTNRASSGWPPARGSRDRVRAVILDAHEIFGHVQLGRRGGHDARSGDGFDRALKLHGITRGPLAESAFRSGPARRRTVATERAMNTRNGATRTLGILTMATLGLAPFACGSSPDDQGGEQEPTAEG